MLEKAQDKKYSQSQRNFGSLSLSLPPSLTDLIQNVEGRVHSWNVLLLGLRMQHPPYVFSFPVSRLHAVLRCCRDCVRRVHCLLRVR